jgi:hypothetical protein
MRLELIERKLARSVPRGLGGSNPTWLLGGEAMTAASAAYLNIGLQLTAYSVHSSVAPASGSS